AEWYKILQSLPWEQYRSIAADYYNALYHFNKSKNPIAKKAANYLKSIKKQPLNACYSSGLPWMKL
ncbi:hypothetical protein D1AOALGA4SA_5650, partial [Olavius algarvensis Delta 1 endosymbiont]